MRSTFFVLVFVMTGSMAASLQAQTLVDAQICETVESREPVNPKTSFQKGDKAYCWIKVADATVGSNLTVIWSIDDLAYEQKLEMKFANMRTYCFKTLFKPGNWKATIKKADGTTLKELSMTVTE